MNDVLDKLNRFLDRDIELSDLNDALLSLKRIVNFLGNVYEEIGDTRCGGPDSLGDSYRKRVIAPAEDLYNTMYFLNKRLIEIRDKRRT